MGVYFYKTQRSSTPQTQLNKIILTPYNKLKTYRKTIAFQLKSEEVISNILDPIIENVCKKNKPKYS